MKNLTVLSLFDGISCGQEALKRAGFTINTYYASEINKNAIAITKKNFPNTIELGDVRNIQTEQYKGKIDLLLGGSPCTNFANCGNRQGCKTKEGLDVLSLEQYMSLKEQDFEFDGYSYLFWEYVRILEEIKPRYFLLENVLMADKWKNLITETLGVQPLKINSSLVSAQSRERLYWSNIPNINIKKRKNIYIEDIIQTDIQHTYLPLTRQDYSNYDKTKVDKTKHKLTAIQIGNSKQFGNAVRNNGKAFTLRRIEPNGILDENYRIRRYTPIEVERLQTLPDNYTYIEGISNTVRYECLGNGWTVDIIKEILKGLKKV